MNPSLSTDAQIKALASRFVDPSFNIADDPERRLLKSGTLSRQARFKTVPRVCFLFSDVFIFAHNLDKDTENGKLEMKQVIDLATATLDDRTGGKTNMKNAVSINSPERAFVVSAASQQEKDEWTNLLAKQILERKKVLETKDPGKLKDSEAIASVHAIVSGTVHSHAFKGELAELEALLEKSDVDVNKIDSDGRTPLQVALKAGHPDIVDLLMEYKADPSTEDPEGNPALHAAVLQSSLGMLAVILQQDGLCNSENRDKRTPLYLAVMECTQPHVASIIEALVKAGANLNQKFADDRTLLHLAALNNKLEAMTALLTLGASVTAVDVSFSIPLHFAASGNYLDACKVLLDFGSGPNLRDDKGHTCLHLTSSPEVAACLISHGARLDMKNLQGIVASKKFDDTKDSQALHACQTEYHNSPPTVSSEPLPTDKEKWLDDDLSPGCLLCASNFTMTSRRHHCRRCGLLVCGNCSHHKFTAPNEPKPQRACDPCYSILRYRVLHPKPIAKAVEPSADDASLRLEKQRQRQAEDAARRRKIQEQTTANKTLRDGLNEKPDKDKFKSNTLDATNAIMHENRRLLIERGEQLDELAEKGKTLEEQAKGFADKATQLKQKMKS